MRISRLSLINWKNFKKVDNIELPYRVFIVGPNASGKSNLLDAIRFLRDIVKQGGGLQEAIFSLRGGISKIRCVAARSNTDITIGVVVNNENDRPEWEYRLTFNQTGGGITDLRVLVKEEYLKNQITGTLHINRILKDKESEYQKGFTYIEQASRNEEFKPFIDFLGDISYLHLIPQLIRDPKSFLKISKGEDYYGRDFLEKVQRMNKRYSGAYIKRIECALKYAVPNFEKLNFEPDEMGVPHFEAIFKQWRGQGVKYQENDFSDGTLRLIGLLWALQDGTKPILLEEPELSLHSSIIRQLPDIIYQFQRKKTGKRQVIVTTHSYEIFDNKGIAGEEILLVSSEGEEGSKLLAATSFQDIKSYLMAGTPVGNLLIARSTPKNINQLSLEFD
ncbi:MAG: AAA family ATPase [Tannerella sp.]|jgi:predicted ATPase|nr:AAA family ATPase [Tannerella sp.]